MARCECGCGAEARPGRRFIAHHGAAHARAAKKTFTLEERFWAKVDKRSVSECWEWRGARHPSYGYGFMLRSTNPTRWWKAHRLSWQLHNGEIPEGLFICHHCDNPPCVNPAHLYAGTAQDNAQDRADRHRGREGREIGELSPVSKLTAKQVLEISGRLAQGEVQDRLAEEYGVSQVTIWRIAHRTTWKHLWPAS